MSTNKPTLSANNADLPNDEFDALIEHFQGRMNCITVEANYAGKQFRISAKLDPVGDMPIGSRLPSVRIFGEKD
jgi:hypothetical protein